MNEIINPPSIKIVIKCNINFKLKRNVYKVFFSLDNINCSWNERDFKTDYIDLYAVMLCSIDTDDTGIQVLTKSQRNIALI